MPEEACPRDLPEQGVQPRVTTVISTGGYGATPDRVDDQHDTNPDNQ